MPLAACRSCRKLIQIDATELEACCAECRKRAPSAEVRAPASVPPTVPAPILVYHMESDSAPKPSGDDGFVSLWFIGAIIFYMTAMVLMMLIRPKSGDPALWMLLLLFVIANGLSLAGVYAKNDKEKRRKRLQDESVYKKAVVDKGELSHRWAWLIFRAVGAILLFSLFIGTIVAVVNHVSFLAYLIIVSWIVLGGVAFGVLLYLIVAMPRVVAAVAARIIGRAKHVDLSESARAKAPALTLDPPIPPSDASSSARVHESIPANDPGEQQP